MTMMMMMMSDDMNEATLTTEAAATSWAEAEQNQLMTEATEEEPRFDAPEPTEESTIEEVLEYVVLTRLSQEADSFREAVFAHLDDKYNELRREVVRVTREKENQLVASSNAVAAAATVPGVDAASGGSASAGKPDESSAPPPPQPRRPPRATDTDRMIRVVALEGPHAGQSFSLRCTLIKPCLVGRSKQHQFKRNGVSLHNDFETSTKHAEIRLDPDTRLPCIVDTGSSNGTFLLTTLRGSKREKEATKLEPHVKVQLDDGMMLQMGRTVVKIEYEE